MLRFLPARPDFVFEFFGRALARADTVAGIAAILASLYFDGDGLQAALRIVGYAALGYGAYDVFREERVSRLAREREVAVHAEVAGPDQPFGHLSFEAFIATKRIAGVNVPISFAIHAQNSDIRTRTILLRLFDIRRRRRWRWIPLLEVEALTPMADVPANAPAADIAPRTLVAHGDPWEGILQFEADYARSIRYRGRVIAKLVLVTNAPDGAEFLSEQFELMSDEMWELDEDND